MPVVTMQELLESGVHYGARASLWCPKMAPYIHSKHSDIHIIDLRETLKGVIRACRFLEQINAQGKRAIFVGTKRQASEVVRAEAARAGQFFVAGRWLGGTLTNLRTIRERISRLEELEELEKSGAMAEFSKKMISNINREKTKISANFEGIREMKGLPGAIILIDPKNEHIALAEAMKLGVPVVALADTDCNPDPIDFLIPGNDDSFRSISLIITLMADACERGRKKYQETAQVQERAAGAQAGGAQQQGRRPQRVDAAGLSAASFGGKEE